MPSELSSPLPGTTAAEPCPPPLEWRGVLDQFRAECREVACGTGRRAVSAAMFGAGQPLYFLGRAAGDRELFSLLAWLLRDEFCCVFVEYPAVGWPPGGLEPFGAAVLLVADRLQHDRFALFAAGFGSGVALQLSLSAGERLTAQILVGGQAHLRLSGFEWGLLYWGSLAPGTIGHLPGWRALQRRNDRIWFPPFDRSRFDFLQQNLARSRTAQTARRVLLAARRDFRPQLRDVNVRTLLIGTEGEGAMVRASQEELRSNLARVEVEWMHSSGRFPYLTHPHRVAKLIRAFLAESA